MIIKLISEHILRVGNQYGTNLAYNGEGLVSFGYSLLDINTGEVKELKQNARFNDKVNFTNDNALLRFSGDGTLLVRAFHNDNDSSVEIWNMRIMTLIYRENFSGRIETMYLTPDNKYIILGAYAPNNHSARPRTSYHELFSLSILDIYSKKLIYRDNRYEGYQNNTTVSSITQTNIEEQVLISLFESIKEKHHKYVFNYRTQSMVEANFLDLQELCEDKQHFHWEKVSFYANEGEFITIGSKNTFDIKSNNIEWYTTESLLAIWNTNTRKVKKMINLGKIIELYKTDYTTYSIYKREVKCRAIGINYIAKKDIIVMELWYDSFDDQWYEVLFVKGDTLELIDKIGFHMDRSNIRRLNISFKYNKIFLLINGMLRTYSIE